MKFKKGDKVKWTSQSGGFSRTKKGKVVRILKSSDKPAYIVANKEFPKHKRMFDGRMLPGNSAIAYLVEVRDGKTDKERPKLYMPYPSKLEKI